jgi:hypothetical protein
MRLFVEIRRGERFAQEPIGGSQARALVGGALQDSNLVSPCEDLQLHSSTAPEHRERKNGQPYTNHLAPISPREWNACHIRVLEAPAIIYPLD